MHRIGVRNGRTILPDLIVQSLLQLRGIGCEAIGPVVLRVNGHGFILMPCRRIAAAWPPLARAHGLHNG